MMARILTQRRAEEKPPVHVAGPPEPTPTGPVQRCLRCDSILPLPAPVVGPWWEIGQRLVLVGRRAFPVDERTARSRLRCEPSPDAVEDLVDRARSV